MGIYLVKLGDRPIYSAYSRSEAERFCENLRSFSRGEGARCLFSQQELQVLESLWSGAPLEVEPLLEEDLFPDEAHGDSELEVRTLLLGMLRQYHQELPEAEIREAELELYNSLKGLELYELILAYDYVLYRALERWYGPGRHDSYYGYVSEVVYHLASAQYLTIQGAWGKYVSFFLTEQESTPNQFGRRILGSLGLIDRLESWLDRYFS